MSLRVPDTVVLEHTIAVWVSPDLDLVDAVAIHIVGLVRRDVGDGGTAVCLGHADPPAGQPALGVGDLPTDLRRGSDAPLVPLDRVERLTPVHGLVLH